MKRADSSAVRRAVWGPVSLAVVVVLLGACGQPEAPGSDETVAPTVNVVVQPTIAPDTGTPEPIDPSAPITSPVFDSSLALVSADCTATGKVWSFTGRVENTDTEPHAFTVGVFVTDTADGNQVGGKEIVVTVPPGGSAPVEAKAFYSGRTKGLECLSGVTVKQEG